MSIRFDSRSVYTGALTIGRRMGLWFTLVADAAVGNALLLESGDALLLEDGSRLLLEG